MYEEHGGEPYVSISFAEADKFKDSFRALVKDKLDEYISEAEHQDGKEYWENFENTKEAAADFGRYISVIVDEDLL